ncbi:response regulator [Bacillaceae bacterium SIJ1]|uniref:response regulator n=1 Tax=Litoribacterium kuwaitense TaxID=1398745 RepID=UPI0013ECE71D|nr:response regulator [Litoribacterium kuwaitense]NGP45082.1 response regulator [Litoribacterium kuwaitense]
MIKVLLIDDEETGLHILRVLLSDFDYVLIQGAYTDPFDALQHMKEEQIDAVFLDIEMPGLSGMDVAREIRKHNDQTKLIFVTAHMDFAVEAFEIETMDYVLKPVTKQRLHQSVRRLFKTAILNQTTAEQPSISIRCFGQFDVVLRDRNEPLSWRTNKAKELCAFLVYYEGNVVGRDFIIDALWPDVSVDKGKTSLYTCISYLRKTLKAYGLEEVVLKKGSGYCFDICKIHCDLIEWSQLYKSLLPIQEENKEHYEALASMYNDEFMSSYDWAREKRDYIRAKMTSVFQQLSLFYEKQGDMTRALKYTEKELTLSPYSDDTCQRLINIHLKMNNRTGALLTFLRFKENLNEELGIEPGLQTTQILEQTIKQ